MLDFGHDLALIDSARRLPAGSLERCYEIGPSISKVCPGGQPSIGQDAARALRTPCLIGATCCSQLPHHLTNVAASVRAAARWCCAEPSVLGVRHGPEGRAEDYGSVR